MKTTSGRIRKLVLASLIQALAGVALANDPQLPPPYAQTAQPAMHRDRHNSDYVPEELPSLGTNPQSPSAPNFITRLFQQDETTTASGQYEDRNQNGYHNFPTVAVTGGTYGPGDANRDGRMDPGERVFYVTTGKVEMPNIHAFDPKTGEELWYSNPRYAPLLADPQAPEQSAYLAQPYAGGDPGPDRCVTTASPLADDAGNIYVADCRFLWSFRGPANPTERAAVVNWKVDRTEQLLTTGADPADPASYQTIAWPSTGLFFTSDGQHVGLVSTQGRVEIYDLNAPHALEILALPKPGEPYVAPACDPYQTAREDHPWINQTVDADGDGIPEYSDITPTGIWIVGQANRGQYNTDGSGVHTPETDHPDRDYMLDPCMLKAFFSVQTIGTGQPVTNYPVVTADAQDPRRTRIYVVAATARHNSPDPAAPNDARTYRVDYDPDAPAGQRLRFVDEFSGWMPAGENSATSPDLTGDGRYLVTGSNNGPAGKGILYVFDAATGEAVWVDPEFGYSKGSPTVVQELDETIYALADGLLKVYHPLPTTPPSFRVTQLDFPRFLKEEAKLPPLPENASAAWSRCAVTSSLVAATRNRLLLAYEVGYCPLQQFQSILAIPVYTAELVLDRQAVNAAPSTNPRDPNDGTMALIVDRYDELGGDLDAGWGITHETALNSHEPNALTGYIIYGSQMSSVAEFGESNGVLPAGMESHILNRAGLGLVQAHWGRDFESGVADTISWFYAAAFARTPVPNSTLPNYGDIEGLTYWTNQYLGGPEAQAQFIGQVYAIADFFVLFSEEFQAQYPASLTNTEFVTALYLNMLGRDPDASEVGYWAGRLDHGESRGVVLADFANTAENRQANPLRQSALASFIAFIAADADKTITPEEATVWLNAHPDFDGALVDGN
jgi:hypothetical protein